MDIRMQRGTWIPWGKLSDDRMRLHPLLDHQMDVASVMLALTKVIGIRRALERAAGRSLSDIDVTRLGALAYLHDIGKASTGFQVRFWEGGGRERRPAYWHVKPCGHGPQGWSLFQGSLAGAERILAGLPLEEMDGWGASTFELLHASISHHGRPVTPVDVESIWTPIRDGHVLIYDPAETVAAMGQALRQHFAAAFVDDADELPARPEFSHLFAGLVQLADWLGSDTREGFFPFSQADEVRALTAPGRARHAIRAVGIDAGDWQSRQARTTDSFAQAFQVPAPRQMQAAMAADDLGALVILEAETGSGKTEAALWRFLHLWRAGLVDSLYFALPTRVAASQLYERVRAFVEQAWSSDRPVVLRALPGYTAADGESFQALPEFKVLWHDEPSDEDAERRWAAESPKRYLAATLAVGTIDQALLGSLQIKHAHMRQAMLSRSLLVIDEVHASDSYMTRLSEHLLRVHLACGGQALLLSATLGAIARTRYLSLGPGGESKDIVPGLAEAAGVPYPAVSCWQGEGREPRTVTKQITGNAREKRLSWKTLEAIDDYERVAALAVEAAAKGARVLIIRNTVPAAIETLHAVEALAKARQLDCLFKLNGVSTLHHSRFSRADRPLLDQAVEHQLGKHRGSASGLILIGTQTLEQSLDIDADLLITDLCPMDVLLQRVGRLHRHERPSGKRQDDRRPSGFELPFAWVLIPTGGDLAPMLDRQRHGLGPIRIKGQPMGGVYADLRVLEATRRLIVEKAERCIPADNRELVEKATHPEALDNIAAELGGRWQRFGQEYDGGLRAVESVAEIHAIAFECPFDCFRSRSEDEFVIGSRLGAADRLLVFSEEPMGPFGIPVRQLTLRHHMVERGLPADVVPTRLQILPDGSGFSFVLGSTQYRYSRLGVERLPSMQGE
ncbi:MAG: CRISPR-associated helicase Cas3' [Lautropia sp.]|nr:CRISPR-associated helicase Cas3' [Lautropia sp.]